MKVLKEFDSTNVKQIQCRSIQMFGISGVGNGIMNKFHKISLKREMSRIRWDMVLSKSMFWFVHIVSGVMERLCTGRDICRATVIPLNSLAS